MLKLALALARKDDGDSGRSFGCPWLPVSPAVSCLNRQGLRASFFKEEAPVLTGKPLPPALPFPLAFPLIFPGPALPGPKGDILWGNGRFPAQQ